MPLPFMEKPVKPLRTESPGVLRRRTAAMQVTDRRAEFRHACARFVRQFDGPVREARIALVSAIENGDLVGPDLQTGQTVNDIVASEETLRRWRNLPSDDATIQGLRDKPRPGRPAVPLHKDLEKKLKDLAADGPSNITAIHAEIVEEAARLGLKEEEIPTYKQVYRRMADVPLAERSAGRHGKEAALADAVVHGAVPAAYPHDVTTEDELDSGVWVRAYSPELKQLVAVQPPIAILVDNFTGAIIAREVINPLLRDATVGPDTWDILSLYVGAYFPEFAAEPCRPYAGFLPNALRMDSHGSHREARDRLSAIGVHVPWLPVRRPWVRGIVEKSVAMLKDALRNLRGHQDKYHVAEHANRNTNAATQDSAGTSGRKAQTIPLLTTQLMTLEEFTGHLDRIMTKLLTDLDHSEFGMPRHGRYLETVRPDLLRSGREALTLLAPRSVRIGKEGIKIGEVAFLPVDPDYHLTMGRTVEVRIDPALRGLFIVEPSGHLTLCLLKEVVSASRNSADFAKAMNAEVSVAYRLANTLREERRRAFTGEIGAAHADAVDAQQLDLAPGVRDILQEVRASTPKPPKAEKSTRSKSTTRPSPRAMSRRRATAAAKHAASATAPIALPPSATVVPAARAPLTLVPGAGGVAFTGARRVLKKSFRF